jgi:hypothetical protein
MKPLLNILNCEIVDMQNCRYLVQTTVLLLGLEHGVARGDV